MKPTKQEFLNSVQRLNRQLAEPDTHLKKEQALLYYDKEIAPYGYPSHQERVIKEARTMYYYNCFIVDSADETTGPDGNKLPGEGFATSTEILSLPTYYITDDLADSLIQTETPKKNDLDLEVLPELTIVFSKKFSKLNTVRIHTEANEIIVRVDYMYEKAVVPFEYSIPITQKDSDCCVLCDARETFKRYQCKNLFKLSTVGYFHKKPQDTWKEDEMLRDLVDVKKVDACMQDFVIDKMPISFNFVINLLHLLQQEPDIISVQKSTSKYASTSSRGFGSVKVNNVPNTHWLGEGFTTRVSYANNTDPEDPKGKPKRSHWRRGHWHTILQGPGRKQKTMKWFKPTFIRGHKQTEEVSK